MAGSDKRAALLEAAEQVFVERGIARATIDEITARAGVAKGTFYLYFSSKEELARALNDRLWYGHVELAQRAAERLVDPDGWWDVVDGFLEEMIDYDLAHRDWHRLAAQSGSPMDPQDLPEQELIDIVAAAVEAGTAVGACHSDDPRLTAILLYRACQGTSHQMCISDETPDRDRIVQAVQTFVRRALAGPD